ncbi:hypothetical protein NBRC110019_18130 [Neptunitalea chrysea]|uniref:Uncharacterized protein n=1 Tax=Neptunitalea chrysea TaxID=1647581 RepID=A0A9W6B517_9FLAO|nr:tetratricopeptide repeat protein [Neptunitalea chrysea]GLB52773.1 hypothetical protein NBRC110019_18130 [Neptunitalea chrysea]
METTKSKWYNRKSLLIILLFTFPIVGTIGIFKRGSKTWKKITYLICSIISSFILFLITIAILFPINYYEKGNELLKNGKYKEAITSFKRVEENEENYTKARNGIEVASKKMDSIEKLTLEKEEQLKLATEKKLKEIEKIKTKWADSIIKFWKGSFIASYDISPNNDTIYFQLTKKASKGNWRSSTDIFESMYVKNIDSVLARNIKSKYNLPKISFTPNKEQEAINQQEAKRVSEIQKQFSVWDGSHIKLKRYIKNNMNDPSSFDHVESTYTDKGSYIYVYMKFREKNAFGAKVLNTVRAKVDLQGNILSIKQL